MRSIPLDQYDPWPTRLGIIFSGSIGLGAVVVIAFLKSTGEDITGLITIPVSAVMAIANLVPSRPPWSATIKSKPTQPGGE